MTNITVIEPRRPSWLRWPPNCCETCVGWNPSKTQQWIGTCNQGSSFDHGTTTDSRYRCPSFIRKDDV